MFVQVTTQILDKLWHLDAFTKSRTGPFYCTSLRPAALRLAQGVAEMRIVPVSTHVATISATHNVKQESQTIGIVTESAKNGVTPVQRKAF
jgi:hypothetical protein